MLNKVSTKKISKLSAKNSHIMDCENANNDAVADAPPSAENESPDNIVNTDKTSSPVIEPETTPIENVSSESHVNTDQINPPLTNENVSTGDIGSSASNADINPPADIISPSTNENDTSETDNNADDGIKTVLETNKDNILPNESIDTNPSTETPEEKPSESISSNTEDKLDSCTIESDKTQNDTDETNSNELGSTKPEDSEVSENVTADESNISPDVPSCKDLSSENVNNSLPENEDSTNMETHIPPSHLEINSTDPKDAGESVGETKPSYPDSKELSAQVEPTESDITDKTVEHCDTTDVESSIALSEQSTPDEQTLVEASSDQTEPSDIQISTEDNTDNHQQESSTEISAKEKNIDGMIEKSALVKNTSALVEEKEEESINRPTDIVDSEKTNHVISSEANDLPDTSSDSIEKVTSKSIENENLSQEEIENSVADKPSCPVSEETEKTTEESTPSSSLPDSRISSELTEQSDPNADNNTSLETDEVNVNGGESLTKGGLEDEQSTETLKNDAASPNATSEKDEAMEVVDSVEIGKEEPMDVDTNDDVVSDSNNTTTSEEINSKDMEPSTEADTSDKTAASDEKPPDAALAEEDKNEATLQIEKGKDDENIIDQNIEIAGDNKLKKDEHVKDVEKNSENASGKNKDSESSVEVEKDDSKSSSKEDVEDSNVISKESKEKSTEKLPDNNVPHTSTETTENKKGSKKIDDTIIYEKFECKPLIIRADINMEEVQKLKSAPLILGDSIVVKSVASLNKTEEEEKQKKSSEDEHPKKANEIELPRKTKSKAVERSSDRTKTRAKPTKEDVPKKTKEKEVPTTIKEKEKVVEKPEEEDKPKIKCKKMDSIQETKKDTREPSKRLIIKSQSSINESVMTSKSAPTPPPSADAGDIEIMDEKYTKNPMRMYEVCKELKKMSRTQSSLLLAESKKAKKKIALKEQYQLEELTADNIGSLDTSAKSFYKMDDPAKTLLFCSMYCGIRYKLRKMDTNPVQLRRRCCGFCSRIVNPDEKSLTWKTKNFCEKKCLSKHQQALGDLCNNCNTHIPLKVRGRYILQRGSIMKIFCSPVCRAYHKSANKYCAICSKVSEGTRMLVVGDYKLCSQDCLKKLSSYKKTQGNTACCTVCHLNKPVLYDVLSSGDKLNHLCSEKCFKAFNFVNKLDVVQCNLCEKYFDKSLRQEDAVLGWFDDLFFDFCSRFCYQVYVGESKTKAFCAWCKAEKSELSMIRRVYEDNEYFYCTVNCLSMLNVEKTVIAKSKQCDYCKSYSTDMFFISAYLTTKSFCTYKCVYNFHNNIPLISEVRSLSSANAAKSLPPPPAPIAKPAAPPPKPARVVPSKIIKPKYEVTKILPKIIRQILIKPQEKKEMKNAATQVKPTTSTKRVSCKTTAVTKECQTGDDMGRPLLIPVPVPLYVPSPAAMYSVPFPVLVPIPIPIPVPVFIPTTRNSAAGIFKEIKRIQEKIPADPFEAELLMMAEMVASDKKDDGGTTDEDSNAPDDDFDNEGGGMETSNNAFGEDVLQMAIKMACNDLETPSGGLQAVDLDDALQPNTITITQAQRTENNSEDLDVQDAMFRSNRGRKRGTNNKPPMSRAPPIKRQRRTSDLIPQAPPVPPPAQPPYTFGVNAWRQWVVNKNLELEKSAAASGNRKPNTIKLFKPEILQLTADELNFSLCLFVKEVRKPNGTQYAPDTIYYLCLGIQQYLFESGRIDNIFTDPYYEKFTEALDEVCCKFSALYNDTQFIVTRVEEEHLWESKQLGAHSPHVLLNTLMFFNTKHFNLITVEEHMQLSFSHIMKHWKRNPSMAANIATNCTKAPPGSRNVLLRFYPPQSAIDAPGSRKKKVYEQQENEENPLRCPVRLYEFYLSKCPESVKTRNDVFYLLPERSCVPDSPVWYSTTPLNKEALMKMLHRIKMVKEINIAFLSL
ncbi:hypothetical protein M8J76_004668 [Diaphorina citri]|nr:hypothetical protein M8J76_004668 [Diaphorina citri]